MQINCDDVTIMINCYITVKGNRGVWNKVSVQKSKQISTRGPRKERKKQERKRNK